MMVGSGAWAVFSSLSVFAVAWFSPVWLSRFLGWSSGALVPSGFPVRIFMFCTVLVCLFLYIVSVHGVVVGRFAVRVLAVLALWSGGLFCGPCDWWELSVWSFDFACDFPLSVFALRSSFFAALGFIT